MSALTMDEPPVRRSSGGILRRLARGAAGGTFYKGVRAVYRLARGEELRAPYPLRYKLSAWRRGFRASTAAVYNLPTNDWRDYLSDYARIYRCININPASQLFDQKPLMHAFLLAKGFPQAETIALVNRDEVRMHPFTDGARLVSPAVLRNWLLEDGGRFIVKPQNGTFGRGVYLLEVRDGVIWQRDGKHVTPFRLSGCDPVSLIERVVEQGEFWLRLCPDSFNTIRILTMWTPGDEQPFVARAVQRIGTAETAPTDNWTAGGIAAPIDLATGRMGIGRMHPVKGKGNDVPYTSHPDTGAQIEDAVLPHWGSVLDVVRRAAASLPVNRYVGWDVLVDKRGRPIILEGNGNTGVTTVQIHGGLLADPAVRRFYERVGVV